MMWVKWQSNYGQETVWHKRLETGEFGCGVKLLGYRRIKTTDDQPDGLVCKHCSARLKALEGTRCS